MMSKYDIEYNGQTARSLGVFLSEYPTFSGAEKSYTTTQMAGKLGELVGQDEGKSNLIIECIFAIVSKRFPLKVIQIKEWLSGTGNLTLSDSEDRFYRVWKIDYGDMERELRNYGTFSAMFTCTPFEYLKEGQELKTIEEVTFNPYSESRPIYKITGEGVCELTVNGGKVTANIGQNVTIDTENMLAYREDGTVQNTAITGDYDDLYLLKGENTISITPDFSLTIIPNWGYEV